MATARIARSPAWGIYNCLPGARRHRLFSGLLRPRSATRAGYLNNVSGHVDLGLNRPGHEAAFGIVAICSLISRAK
jgi:hypothetical protein